MKGYVLSFLKAEWKVSDTGSAHCWAFGPLFAHQILERIRATTNLLRNYRKKFFWWNSLGEKHIQIQLKKLSFWALVPFGSLNTFYLETIRARPICWTYTRRTFNKESKENKPYQNKKIKILNIECYLKHSNSHSKYVSILHKEI
jgi:hypothetical protein